MNHSLERQLESAWPWKTWGDVTVLVAVSGGPDSVALLRALTILHTGHASGAGRLIVVHVNHRLRGTDSELDEAFVRDLAAQWGLSCMVHQAPAPAAKSSEEAARAQRYDFFQQAAQSAGARYVVTAHTAEDQAETILHRILRGTGLDGLAGIPAARELLPGVSLVRPLLTVTRRQILDYLQSLGQSFRQDATNAQLHYTRNRLRNELIPLLEQHYNSRVHEALIRLGQLAGDAHDVLRALVRDLEDRAVVHANPRDLTIHCPELMRAHRYLVRQLMIQLWQECRWPLREMSAKHWERLAELAVNPSISEQLELFPGPVRAHRLGPVLRLVVSSPSPGSPLEETQGHPP